MRTVDHAARAAREKDLLDAAAQCFAERGYSATRTSDICALAGMSAGNLFHYFATKHDVLIALVERDGVELRAHLDELTQAADPLAALLGFLDDVCALASDPLYSGLALEIAAIAHRDEAVAALFKANDLALRVGIAALLALADQAGQVRSDLPISQITTWIAALTDGLFSRVAADPDFDPAAQSVALRVIVTDLIQKDPS